MATFVDEKDKDRDQRVGNEGQHVLKYYVQILKPPGNKPVKTLI